MNGGFPIFGSKRTQTVTTTGMTEAQVRKRHGLSAEWWLLRTTFTAEATTMTFERIAVE